MLCQTHTKDAECTYDKTIPHRAYILHTHIFTLVYFTGSGPGRLIFFNILKKKCGSKNVFALLPLCFCLTFFA